MCKAMETMRNKSLQEGIAQGIKLGVEQGIEQGKIETAINLHRMGLDIHAIAKAVECSVDTVKQWLTASPN